LSAPACAITRNPIGQQHTGGAAANRQNKALDQQLPDQAATPGPERRAHAIRENGRPRATEADPPRCACDQHTKPMLDSIQSIERTSVTN